MQIENLYGTMRNHENTISGEMHQLISYSGLIPALFTPGVR